MRSKIKSDIHRDVRSLNKVVFITISIIYFYK